MIRSVVMGTVGNVCVCIDPCGIDINALISKIILFLIMGNKFLVRVSGLRSGKQVEEFSMDQTREDGVATDNWDKDH